MATNEPFSVPLINGINMRQRGSGTQSTQFKFASWDAHWLPDNDVRAVQDTGYYVAVDRNPTLTYQP